MLAETNQINAMPAQIQAQTRALNASAAATEAGTSFIPAQKQAEINRIKAETSFAVANTLGKIPQNATELENAYQSHLARNPGSDISINDYAKAINYSGGFAPTGMRTSSNEYTIDKYSDPNNTTNYDGNNISFANDPAKLVPFIAANIAIPSPVIQNAVNSAKSRLDQINNTGKTYDTNGNLISVPGSLATEANRAAFNDFNNQASKFGSYEPDARQRLNQLSNIYGSYKSGIGAPMERAASSVLERIAPGSTTNATSFDLATKFAASGMLKDLSATGARAPASELEVIKRANVNAENQPAANYELMVNTLAMLNQQRDLYQSWIDNNRPNDVVNFQRKFNEKHPISSYMDQAYKDTIIPKGATEESLLAATGRKIPFDPTLSNRGKLIPGQTYMLDGHETSQGITGPAKWTEIRQSNGTTLAGWAQQNGGG
jgi:hypothetical protein